MKQKTLQQKYNEMHEIFEDFRTTHQQIDYYTDKEYEECVDKVFKFLNEEEEEEKLLKLEKYFDPIVKGNKKILDAIKEEDEIMISYLALDYMYKNNKSESSIDDIKECLNDYDFLENMQKLYL